MIKVWIQKLLENLEVAKMSCQEQYKELQQQEEDLVTNLNKKYGIGTVDVNTGEFIPKNWLFGNLH